MAQNYARGARVSVYRPLAETHENAGIFALHRELDREFGGYEDVRSILPRGLHLTLLRREEYPENYKPLRSLPNSARNLLELNTTGVALFGMASIVVTLEMTEQSEREVRTIKRNIGIGKAALRNDDFKPHVTFARVGHNWARDPREILEYTSKHLEDMGGLTVIFARALTKPRIASRKATTFRSSYADTPAEEKEPSVAVKTLLPDRLPISPEFLETLRPS